MTYNGYTHTAGPPTLAPMTGPTQAPFQENGRFYGTYRPGQYLLPIDEEELDRMDIFHKFFLVSRQYDTDSTAGLHQGPPIPPEAKVLDLGCGTGIWVIDMAERYYYQNVQVTGFDLNLTQPEKIPPNTTFRQLDITNEQWPVEPDSFDIIAMRMLTGSIKEWRPLYENIFRQLKPGVGVFEHVELDFFPRSADGNLLQNSALEKWAVELHEAFQAFGQPLIISPDPETLLKQTGFVDVQHKIKTVPFHPWPENEVLKDMGRWFNLGMTQGIEALTMAPLTRLRNYSKAEVLKLTQDVRKEIGTRSFRVSCTMHIWTARRPPARAY